MNPFAVTEVQILGFALVLIRISAFAVTWPVFGQSLVPNSIKVLFALTVALVIYPVISLDKTAGGLESMTIVWLAIREVFIGLAFGFLARSFFYAMTICGELISTSLGLANAQLFNPALGGRSTATEQFIVTLASLFFLVANGHHIMLSGIIDSFRLMPLGGDPLSFVVLGSLGQYFQDIVEIGIQLSAPIVVAIFILNIAMGVLGRAVPQINVLISSIPVNILAGLAVLIASMPLMFWQMDEFLEITTTNFFKILRNL